MALDLLLDNHPDIDPASLFLPITVLRGRRPNSKYGADRHRSIITDEAADLDLEAVPKMAAVAFACG